MNWTLFISGIVMFSAGLWGGAFLMDMFGKTWAGFPILITAVISCVIGFASFLVSIVGFLNTLDYDKI